jgi:DNA-binding MarR family transcriptional regulator
MLCAPRNDESAMPRTNPNLPSKPHEPARGAFPAAGAEGAAPFDLEHHVFYWMTQVMNGRDRQINSELRPYRIRVPEWRILALLKSRQSLSIGETAATIGLDHATMSRTVDRMVRAGHVLRLSDTADLRVTRLSLTAAGSKLFDEVWPIVSRLNRDALVRLPEGATSLLCLALAEMQRAMEENWRRTWEKTKRKNREPRAARR